MFCCLSYSNMVFIYLWCMSKEDKNILNNRKYIVKYIVIVCFLFNKWLYLKRVLNMNKFSCYGLNRVCICN